MEEDGGASSADDLAHLRGEVHLLTAAFRDAQSLLGRCIVLSTAASLVALRVGREQESLIKASGLTPTITPSLHALEYEIGKMQDAMQELTRRGE
jgi:hypothetical protein